MTRRVTRFVQALSIAALAVTGTHTLAQTAEKLQATFSIGHAFAQGKWETEDLPGPARTDMVVGRVPGMVLSLAIPSRYTAPPRRVKIYLSLPQTFLGLTGAGTLELSWQTGGRFLPGTVRAGQRVVLYEGIADRATLSDSIAFQVRVSGSDMDLDRVDIEPIYEIEGL